MKNYIVIFSFLFYFLINFVYSQNITITDDESYVPDNSVILDIKSDSKGVLLPRLTDSQRDALSINPPEGMIIYNTTDKQLQVFIDDCWHPLTMGTRKSVPVIDYDNNVYQTILIANQIWMTENLKSRHYSDGTPLIDGTDSTDITGDDSTKYYFYYNDDSATYFDQFGLLYTMAAVMNNESSSTSNPSGVQGICPDGWHLPSDDEWKELELIHGMSQGEADATGLRGTDEGDQLKAVNGWYNNGNGTNERGFNALPSGYRDNTGAYSILNQEAIYRTATDSFYRYLYYNESGIYRYNNYKSHGFSVRCVKD